MAFSAKTREEALERLKSEELDLLVVGGGITGAGVAVQAAASGIKTGLIEMQDFAGGTSSRSTKLVHGGIRYLKQFDVGVVSDTVQERAVVQGIAPHIPKPFPMLLPIYDEPGITFDMFSIKIAMDLYDRLAGVTGTQYENYTITPKEVLQREPNLQSKGLLGAGVYLDYVNNDARLVIENVKEAVSLGALAVSRVQAKSILHDEKGKVSGLRVKDLLSGKEFDVKAKLVINTTGPWSAKFRDLDKEENKSPDIRPTKGVHLVVDSKLLPVPQPTYIDTGYGDGRMTFFVPREGKTYFGTTDTDYTGDYSHPKVEKKDVDYLLGVIARRFPSAKVSLKDIQASWAGLRPLIAENGSSDYNGGTANVGKVSDASFKALVESVNKYEEGKATKSDVEKAISKLKTASSEASLKPSQVSRGSDLYEAPDGMITLSGGKITDYRKMAAGALALIRKTLKDRFKVTANEIDSKKLQVSGGHFDPKNVDATLRFYAQIAQDAGVPEKDAVDLANRFGSNTSRVVTYAKSGKAVGLSLAETLSLRYSVNEEMVLSPVDYLLRRTNAILFHSETVDSLKGPVVKEMGKLLGWDKDEEKKALQEVDEVLSESRLDYLKKK